MPEQRKAILTGLIVGAAVTLPLVAVMYLGAQAMGLPMVAFDFFESLIRIQQLGGLVTKAIEVMVGVFSQIPGVDTDSASKAFEQFSAVGLFVLLGALVGGFYGALRTRLSDNGTVTLWIIAWIFALSLELSIKSSGAVDQLLILAIWLGVLFWGWSAALVRTTNWLLTPRTVKAPILPGSPDTITLKAPVALPAGQTRRDFLMRFAGSVAAITVGAVGLGSLLGRRAENSAGKPINPPIADAGGAATAEPVSTSAANKGFIAAPGTRAEVTPNSEFYRVDLNVASPPSIEEKTYLLDVRGAVKTPLKLSYADIRAMPPTMQDATLECISNPVGGDLISSTRWTGIKLRDVLNKVGLNDGVIEIRFNCADGYTESLPLESAMDERTLLTYAMNGEALSEFHGFPIRLYVPNRYGMKNPKWITSIEAVTEPYQGYWEDRGWDKEAIVKSTSIIDTIAKDSAVNGLVPVGGIAFSGARQISKVELSVDDGPWQEAALKDPISPLTWRLWRFDWKAPKGQHKLTVRTTDGQGNLQISAIKDLHPDGASGYVSKQVDI